MRHPEAPCFRQRREEPALSKGAQRPRRMGISRAGQRRGRLGAVPKKRSLKDVLIPLGTVATL